MKELRVALIGGGFMGRAHSMAYSLADLASDPGVKLVKQLVVDDDPEVASRSSELLGWHEHATDWREAVNRPDIDVIDICTPPQFHAPIAIAALRAGKHVFCEKPITNSSDEAIAMRDEARQAGVVTQVGFNYRHTPAVAFAKKLLDAGMWIAEYSNGAIGSFAVSSAASGRKNQYYYALDCTQAAVEFDWNRREEFRVSYVDDPKDHLGFRTIYTNDLHPGGWWRLAGLGTGYVEVSAIQIQEFVSCIVSGGDAQPGFADATHTQQVVEAVYQAARDKAWIEVPPRQQG